MRHRVPLARPAIGPCCLDQVPLPAWVQVVGFAERLPVAWRNRLMAYGLTPGTRIEVRQTRPLVILRVEHLELALEREVAAQVCVQSVSDDQRKQPHGSEILD